MFGHIYITSLNIEYFKKLWVRLDTHRLILIGSLNNTCLTRREQTHDSSRIYKHSLDNLEQS
jgi:hypothetical protein